MNRENAIYYLQSSGFSEEQITAIEQAFKDEPCADAISRQAAKDLGAECIAKRDENGNLIPLGSIDSLPSVSTEKTGRWIPVSERLPEDGEDVLVYMERNAWVEDELKIKKKCIDIGWQNHGRWHCDGCNGVVGIKWMPLPEEPYKGESEG